MNVENQRKLLEQQLKDVQEQLIQIESDTAKQDKRTKSYLEKKVHR
jgi:phage shock protein A